MNKLNLMLCAAIIILFALWIGNWDENTRLRFQIEQTEKVVSSLQEQQKQAMNAAANAIKARENVNEIYQKKIWDAEKSLEYVPEFDNIPIPDDIRMLWKKDGSAAGAVSPSRYPVK